MAGLERVFQKPEHVSVVMFNLSVSLDQIDHPVLCSTIRSVCKYLVTGEKRYFGHLYHQTVEGVTAISPDQFTRKFERFARHLSSNVSFFVKIVGKTS